MRWKLPAVEKFERTLSSPHIDTIGAIAVRLTLEDLGPADHFKVDLGWKWTPIFRQAAIYLACRNGDWQRYSQHYCHDNFFHRVLQNRHVGPIAPEPGGIAVLWNRSTVVVSSKNSQRSGWIRRVCEVAKAREKFSLM